MKYIIYSAAVALTVVGIGIAFWIGIAKMLGCL